LKKNISPERPINLLDLVPESNIHWKKNEEGLIILQRPKFRHPLLVKYILPRMKRPHYNVILDAMGSFIFEQCDGKITVRELGEKLKEKFGEKIEPLFDRLSLFLQHLERHRFIKYQGIGSVSPSDKQK